MARCLIIADDLTGANATGVLLQKINYPSFTVIDAEHFEREIEKKCDCIICPTDSRAIDSEVAYERVFLAAKMLGSKDTLIYAKRIDSTLRGNLGSETDALLDALGDGFTAIAVPAFPQSGRIVCGGYMLVNGVPLHKTEAAIDPKTPVSSSSVYDLFSLQSKYNIRICTINDLMKGKKHVINYIHDAVRSGTRIITFDCIGNEDTDFIADAVIESGIPFICVDPGPFTAAVVRKKIIPKEDKKNIKLLALVGSVNPVARLQIEELFLSHTVFKICVRTRHFIESDTSRREEINRVVKDFLAGYTDYQICCIYGDGLQPENKLDFSEYEEKNRLSKDELCILINESFAEILFRILEQAPQFAGLYTSGGDITVAVCKKVKAAGIKLIGEVLPLAAYGELIGGIYGGLKIITKGGMAGDKDAMKKCIQYMQEHLLL
ncbi:four-carbon acid sugar kinase family protein [Treponema sp. HNW]|uniref:four-carbon acid sugar kinase family protein n=1 Tax=Treponema sp. HNW TaxID=3116654 RepID=UPI003D11FA4F